MIATGLDLFKLSKLTSQQIDHITCLECCKPYLAPETAVCGHTLCHTCWRGRRACPACSIPLERRNLKLNLPLQTLTEHVHALGVAFEKLFHIKLDEFILDTPGEIESANDPAKNVKDWLASSQNHFSAPAHSSQESQEIKSQEIPNPLELSTNKIQIHTNSKKIASPLEMVHVSVPQDDWDKIEKMPDSEEINKNKENIIGPMDIENFFIDEKEYTSKNPRRSSRKRELKNNDSDIKINNISIEKQSSKDSSCEADKKMHKNIQNWSNVKRMRKEFSKLNKKNRNKLNVSIEMCKKTQSTVSKRNITTPHVDTASEQLYDIDDKTPVDTNNKKKAQEPIGFVNNAEVENLKVTCNPDTNNIEEIKEIMQKTTDDPSDYYIPSNNDKCNEAKEKKHVDSLNVKYETATECNKSNTDNITEAPKTTKLPFFKKSALYPNYEEEKYTQIINHNIDSKSVTTHTDDIEISIKIGNTLTNILIRKKNNNVNLKVNTDREIQTSLGPHDLISKDSSISLKEVNVQNIEIDIGTNNNDVAAKIIQPQTLNKVINDSQGVPILNKSTSVKKNTASADTATVQFEITESVEKELSSVMECVENEDRKKIQESQITVEKSLQIIDKKLKKTVTKASENEEDLDYLNDLDIFGSAPTNETNVQLLQNAKNKQSEILTSSVQNKKLTHKHLDKRDRDANDENVFPQTKKMKLNDGNSIESTKAGGNVLSKPSIGPDSEPMNYDSIMGQVFANIDADIEDIQVSQHINKKTSNLINDNKESKNFVQCENTIQTQQHEGILLINNANESTSNLNEYCSQKNSENVFSICVDNHYENYGLMKRNDPLPMSKDTNIDYLTPVISCNQQISNKGFNDIEMVNIDDDSDKSVVEETPQKNISFTKLKQKNNTSKELNNSQTLNMGKQRSTPDKKCLDSENTKNIVKITDTLSESKSCKDVTVIETVTKKLTLDTPITINKFVDQIKHKSTPVARKSLNFDNESIDDNDPEQTLCPTTEPVAKTTQEKEFMSKAFENTPNTPALKPISVRNTKGHKKCCIAGSNLTSADLTKIKFLCSVYNWIFVDKYSKDITHLVVGVDEENKSQRTVKYMCALAASKWIVSFEWIEKCLQTKTVLREEYYEVLDSTGEPGPRRSRLASRKLFQGITFYCMPPFSVLDVDTLKNMLEAAGGRIVNEVKEVRITDKSNTPAILLAEPENTQEDRFIYLAMEMSIVPVNYEWALNCLGSYALGSVQELLLCPASLLPSATTKWPAVLFVTEDE